MISRIIKVSVRCFSPDLRFRLISLTSALIILDIKPIIVYFKYRKYGYMYVNRVT